MRNLATEMKSATFNFQEYDSLLKIRKVHDIETEEERMQ